MFQSPLILTRPLPNHVLACRNADFLHTWRTHRDALNSCPNYALFNVNSLATFAETLAILHPLADGDFYYSYCGATRRQAQLRSPTGHNHSSICDASAVAFATCFGAVIESGEPIVALQIDSRSGQALEHAIVPVESPLGRLIVSNTVPVNYTAEALNALLRSAPDAVVTCLSTTSDMIAFRSDGVTGTANVPIATPALPIDPPARAEMPTGVLASGPAISPSDREIFLNLIDLDALRGIYTDLKRRRHELITLRTELNQREAGLAAQAEGISQARSIFESQAGDRRRLEMELRRLAETDDLTGHLNRRAFFRALEIEVSRSKRYGHPPTLLYLDIDRFKSINDTRGHAAGDAIIRIALQRIVSVLRDSLDLIGRLGGDEFAILLPETALSGAQVVAERIRRIISETSFAFVDAAISVTVSIGIAAWNDAADVDGLPERVENWVARADEALYQAKHNGRNTICRAVARGANTATQN